MQDGRVADWLEEGEGMVLVAWVLMVLIAVIVAMMVVLGGD